MGCSIKYNVVIDSPPKHFLCTGTEPIKVQSKMYVRAGCYMLRGCMIMLFVPYCNPKREKVTSVVLQRLNNLLKIGDNARFHCM